MSAQENHTSFRSSPAFNLSFILHEYIENSNICYKNDMLFVILTNDV